MNKEQSRKKKNENIDPTLNVKELVDLQVKRLDDLRLSEECRTNDLRDAESKRVNEVLLLSASYEEKLRLAEAKRIDAIRAVDVNAVSIANERAVQQAAVLQNQVSNSAEALRALVATTASTIAQQLQQITNQTTERLAAVEKAQYEGQGRGTGIKDIYGWLVGLIGLGLYLWSVMHK
jgi:hypothetical protein